jgi:hypothetical protein
MAMPPPFTKFKSGLTAAIGGSAYFGSVSLPAISDKYPMPPSLCLEKNLRILMVIVMKVPSIVNSLI